MREIKPSTLYITLANKIAGGDKVKDALAALFWALGNKAEDYPIIPGYKTLRMAKTDAIRDVPALHLIFRIDDDHSVTLKYIEIAETDEFKGPPML